MARYVEELFDCLFGCSDAHAFITSMLRCCSIRLTRKASIDPMAHAAFIASIRTASVSCGDGSTSSGTMRSTRLSRKSNSRRHLEGKKHEPSHEPKRESHREDRSRAQNRHRRAAGGGSGSGLKAASNGRFFFESSQ